MTISNFRSWSQWFFDRGTCVCLHLKRKRHDWVGHGCHQFRSKIAREYDAYFSESVSKKEGTLLWKLLRLSESNVGYHCIIFPLACLARQQATNMNLQWTLRRSKLLGSDRSHYDDSTLHFGERNTNLDFRATRGIRDLLSKWIWPNALIRSHTTKQCSEHSSFQCRYDAVRKNVILQNVN